MEKETELKFKNEHEKERMRVVKINKNSWKHKQKNSSLEIESKPTSGYNLLDARPYIWETEEAKQLLTENQIKNLNSQLTLISGGVKDETVAKFLQINMYVDLLDEIIKKEHTRMLETAQLKPKQGQRLATLKVTRKQLIQNKSACTPQYGFSNEREILDYSWQLFRDKINSKVSLLANPNDPQTIFNLRKFSEYAYSPRGSDDDSPAMSSKQIKLQLME